ncbi:hypothetical protein HQQ80_06925 [Microbacteriaceae bacterium VKM Ac-2855]|nr:hypothetical protein [Microbacteriaceae bacterium VKM Ac-2855]
MVAAANVAQPPTDPGTDAKLIVGVSDAAALGVAAASAMTGTVQATPATTVRRVALAPDEFPAEEYISS